MKTTTMTASRNRATRVLGAALLAALAGAGQAQDSVRLTPQQDRISDEAIDADLQRYEATQDRIRALNDAGRPVRDYFVEGGLNYIVMDLVEGSNLLDALHERGQPGNLGVRQWHGRPAQHTVGVGGVVGQGA